MFFFIFFALIMQIYGFEGFIINLIEFYGVENIGVDTKITFLA